MSGLGMTEKPIYQNQWYAVVPNDTMDGYHLFNKITGVKEGGSEKLPSAISQADAACSILLERQRKDASNEGSD